MHFYCNQHGVTYVKNFLAWTLKYSPIKCDCVMTNTKRFATRGTRLEWRDVMIWVREKLSVNETVVGNSYITTLNLKAESKSTLSKDLSERNYFPTSPLILEIFNSRTNNNRRWRATLAIIRSIDCIKLCNYVRLKILTSACALAPWY